MCRVGCLISKQGSIKLNFGVHDDDMEDNDDDGINEGNVDDDAGCALLCKLCGHLMSDLKTREDKNHLTGSQEMYVSDNLLSSTVFSQIIEAYSHS